MNGPNDLREWLRGNDLATATRATLVHVGASGGSRIIRDWQAEDLRDGGALEDIPNECHRWSTRDAEGAPGHIQTYELVIWELQEEGDAVRTRSPRWSKRSEAGDSGLSGSEPATPAGLVGQAMRHTEALMRVTVPAMGGVVKDLQEENADLRARLRQGEALRMELIKMREAELDRSADRARKDREAQDKDDRIKQLIDELAPVGQIVLARLMGGGSVVDAGQGLIAAKSAFEKLTSEDMQGILSNLDPAKGVALLEAVKALQEAAENLPQLGPGKAAN